MKPKRVAHKESRGSKMDDKLRVLLPFAKAADDYEPPKSKRRLRDEEHVALSLTVGHLREARRILLKLIDQQPPHDAKE
jgi:hypothetical protein